jgi:hypothetical protein
MDIIVPTTLTSAMLVSSNIAENEYSSWATGGWAALSAGVANWRKMAVNAAGGVYAASYSFEEDIYYAADGVTFGRLTAAAVAWQIMGVDTYNNNIYAAVYGSDVYMQTNGTGAFTDLNVTHRNWAGFTGDGLGSIYACTAGAGAGRIYLWNGSDFAEDHASNKDFRGMCLDPVSGLMYLCVYGGDIYTYDGTTLTALGGTSRNWVDITADAAGNIWAAATGVDVFKRTAGAGAFVASGMGAKAFQSVVYNNVNGYLYCSVSTVDIYRANGTTVYGDGDKVQITTGTNLADHKIYESLTAGNAGNNPLTDTTNWLLTGNTNRTKAFDGTIGAQSSKAAEVTWVLAPGAIDSVALLNISATSMRVAEADHSTDKVTNGTAWTGATGTTQPTGWDKVGTCSDFTINTLGAIRLTADDAGEGISQTIAVTAGTVMMLNGTYRNTSGDVAQIAIYDETHSSDILAVTDLGSSTQYATLNHIFSVPAGCSSLTIKLLCKTSGDIVWFDNISLSDVVYDSGTVTIGTYTSEYINTSLTQKADCLVRVSVYHATGNALVGEMILGVKTNLGTTSKEISGGIKDYSTIEEDTYGYQSITDRGIAKKLSCQVTLPLTSFNTANSIISYYHTTAVVWVASTTYNSTVIYGMYRDYKFQLGDKIATLFFDLQGLV